MPVAEEQREQAVAALRQKLEAFANLPIEQYTHPEFGPLSFEAIRPTLERIRRMCTALLSTDLSDLSYRHASQFLGAFGNIEGTLDECLKFDVIRMNQSNDNPVTRNQQLINQFDNGENAFWDTLSPVAGFLFGTSASAGPNSIAVRTQDALSDLRANVDATASERGKLEKIVSAARDAAAETGASKHSRLFAEEARENALRAGGWLVATAVGAVLTFAAVGGNWYMSQFHPLPSEQGAAIQLAFAKLVALSSLLTATLWCGRQYRAARHNEVVNKHRANALASFQAFAEGASDDQTKNAVLIQATQSIFAPQATGFVQTEPESGGSQLVEIVRTIGGSSSKS